MPKRLVGLKDDARPDVRDRAQELLVGAGEPAIDALTKAHQHSPASEARAAAVWALFRIGTPGAEQSLRTALDDPSFRVRIPAARAAGSARDPQAVDRLMPPAN